MPGGELVTGAPEDVVLSGGIAQAFEGRQIRFHPEERSFRLLTGERRRRASVRGSGLRAALATAVLEREGYAVVPASAIARRAVGRTRDESGWRLSTDDGECSGADFASLAECLRGRRTRS